MTPFQSSFRAALLDPSAPVPDGLIGPAQAPAGKRFDVYRNNVVFSLTMALRAAFPLVFRLLGAEKFDLMAQEFLRLYPPASPLMMDYGAQMPQFLAGFSALTHVGYLADCAGLDIAMRASYHAPNAGPLLLTASALALAEIGQAQLRLAPSARMLRSVWPIFDIWRFNFEQDAPKPQARAQDVLIIRPTYDPVPIALPVGAFDWITALQNGADFETAHDLALAQEPQFNLATALAAIVPHPALVMV